jgi:BirA family biotin operon repressor/biotin-[acetyl-CoA-carboxylase] ligase
LIPILRNLKPLSFTILRLLGDGEFHSGEKIANHFGISRASVWQALKPLNELGLEIFRVPGRGYRLREPVEWLDKLALMAALGDKSSLFNLEILDQADSTNRVLLHKSALGAATGSCVMAELQTAGRGRRGRAWLAGLGGGLTFSVLWRFEQGAGFLSGLSLAVGVALVRALRAEGAADVMLKWPNDVLHQYRKLAGILIEMQGDVAGPCAVVIGIGLNLKLDQAVLEQIDQPAIDVFSVVQTKPGRNRMLASILAHLADVLTEFGRHGFSGLRHEWKSYHVYQEKAVRLLLPNGIQEEGMLLDVAEDGALLLEVRGSLKRFTSGEVSLRGAT